MEVEGSNPNAGDTQKAIAELLRTSIQSCLMEHPKVGGCINTNVVKITLKMNDQV